MSASTPEYMKCSKDVVGGLIETVSVALLGNFPKLSADPYDIELVLDAVRVLRNHVAEINALDGILSMVQGRWDDAIRIFSQVCEESPRFGYAKALLAFCLSVNGDTRWRQCASEAMEASPDRETRALVLALEARDDLMKAMREQNGGTFVVPDSCVALTESENKGDEVEAATEVATDTVVANANHQPIMRA